tara:strand:- start:3249 stop:4064 length:816 start_codon:yes stop_codon:yes gene_type:complete
MFVCQVFAQDAVDSLGCLKCGHNHRSPYDFSFKHELPFILTGVGLVISSEVIKTTNSTKPFNLEELNNLDRNNVNPFDRPTTYKYKPDAAKLSDVFRTGVVIFPILFLANHHTRKDIKGLALLTTEVVVINWGLTNGVKNLVNRTRPYVYNEEVPVDVRTDSQSRLSFFSGHASHTASVSFLFAKVINDYHPEMELTKKICLWGVAATIPAVTAYLRVQSGKHFPTDVMFGYGIGATIGWLVPHLHKVKLPLSVASYSFQDANGISFTYRF